MSIVNAEYQKEIASPIEARNFKTKEPRILARLESMQKQTAVFPNGFSHYRPARYFQENLTALSGKIDNSTRDRFEKAFKELNELLTKGK